MNRRVKSTLLLFTVFNSIMNAQEENKKLFLGSILTDSVFENRNLSNAFGMEHIFKSKNIIEIRLYSELSETNYECIVLGYSDSLKAWSIGKYHNGNERSKLLLSEDSRYIKNNLDSVFKQLTSNNIFTSLPK